MSDASGPKSMSIGTRKTSQDFGDYRLIPTRGAQVVLDANIIISFLSQRRDVEDEIRIAIPGRVRILLFDLVVFELERLARQRSSKVGRWANIGLEYLHKKKYPIVEHRPGPTDVDAALISFAVAETAPTYVVTIDREVKTSLQLLGVPTISPMKRHGLVLVGRPHLST